MASFQDPFDSLAAWDFWSFGNTNTALASTSPSPYLGTSRATLTENDNQWGATRMDLVDGGVAATTYWISYAFNVPSFQTYADENISQAYLFGFININDQPFNVGVSMWQAYVDIDSGANAQFRWPTDNIGGNTPIDITGQDNQWHTVRHGIRFDGANSHETIYLDDVLVGDENVDLSPNTPLYDNGAMGVVIGDFGGWGAGNEASLAVDSLTYSSLADPGEPTEADAGACTGEGLTIRVELDEVDVTDVCVRGAWTPRLNRPAQATVTIPMELAGGDTGSRLKFYLVDGSSETLVFHGLVLNVETTTDKDTGYTQYNAQDPMELWQWRPVRDDGADFSKPDIITAYESGPQILQAMLINTEDSTGRVNTEGEVGGPPPTDAEGPIFLDLISFATGGPNLSGAPTDWPMSIMELFSLLVSTGRLDAVITPIELGANDEMGELSAYNGNYGTDRSADVLFSYGMGARNVSGLRWNRDMTEMVNKYWLYGGPRMSTAADPAGDQHWCFNVTGFDLAFDATATVVGAWANATNYTTGDVVTHGAPTVNYIARQTHTSSATTEPGVGVEWPDFWLVWMAPPGGRAVDTSNNPVGPPWTNNQLGEQIFNSRTSSAGVRMKVDIFDAYDDNCMSGVNAIAHDLYKSQWQTYSWFSSIPRDIIHITPVPDVYIGCFGIGDLVGVEASSEVRGGFSGAQRVYEYTVSWEGTASVLTLSELQVSSDAEGLFN